MFPETPIEKTDFGRFGYHPDHIIWEVSEIYYDSDEESDEEYESDSISIDSMTF